MLADDLSCDTAHELISARLDGEAAAGELARLDCHLEQCAQCRAASAGFARLDRQIRLRAAEPVPDLRDVILARVRPAVLGRGGWMRPALGWVALVLIAQNLSALFAGNLSGAETHLARHLGTFGVALGVGLLFVAWRPSRAYGLLPFAGALIATMLASAGFDIAENGRSAVAESTHLAEIAGLWLVWMIAGSPGWPGLATMHRRVKELMRRRELPRRPHQI